MKVTKNKPLKLQMWMSHATTEEQEELAELAGTSRMYLYQLSAGNREPLPELAGRLEAASKIMRKRSKGRLPLLTRMDLVSACASCPYARKCTARG